MQWGSGLSTEISWFEWCQQTLCLNWLSFIITWLKTKPYYFDEGTTLLNVLSWLLSELLIWFKCDQTILVTRTSLSPVISCTSPKKLRLVGCNSDSFQKPWLRNEKKIFFYLNNQYDVVTIWIKFHMFKSLFNQ